MNEKSKSRRRTFSLGELSHEGKMQIYEWMMGGLSFETVRELAERELGVRMAEGESLEDFWREFCAPVLMEQRKRASVMASEIAEEAAASAVPFEDATLAALKQRSFELMLTPKLDPRMFRQVVGFVMKARDQELSRQRLRLMERRLEQACAVEDVVKDRALSSEVRERKLREIFGLTQ